MKHVEDRARDFIDSTLFDTEEYESVKKAFIAGAESEHKELTRWYNPEKKLPKPMKHVLVKYDCGYYALDFYDPSLGSFYADSFSIDKIIGWREIHE